MIKFSAFSHFERFCWSLIGVAVLWFGWYLALSYRFEPLKNSSSPVVVGHLGKVSLEVIANDIILPVNPGRDFQFDAFLSTAPSNIGNWREGQRGLTLLPISVLTSLALHSGLIDKPTPEEMEQIVREAQITIIKRGNIPKEKILIIDIERQVQTALLFRAIDKLREDKDYAILHKVYNDLSNVDLKQPISVSMLGLPHYKSYKIKQAILLPVFNYAGSKPDFTPKELFKRIRRSVHLAVNNYIDPKVHALAIPALAGTECQIDSRDYLTYHQSFRAILSALKDPPPKQLYTIYLVVWDKLKGNYSSLCKQSLFERSLSGVKWGIIEHKLITEYYWLLATFLTIILCRLLLYRPELPFTITVSIILFLVFFMSQLPLSKSWFQWISQQLLLTIGAPGLFASQVMIGFFTLWALDESSVLFLLYERIKKLFTQKKKR